MPEFTVRLTASAAVWKDVTVRAKTFTAAKNKVEREVNEMDDHGWELCGGSVFDIEADEEPVDE